MAWTACNEFDKILRSSHDKSIKINIFRATVEPILYGSETWTLSVKLHRCFDCIFTKLLRHLPNISWKDHVTLNDMPYFLERAPGHSFKSRHSRGGTHSRGRSFKNQFFRRLGGSFDRETAVILEAELYTIHCTLFNVIHCTRIG